MLVFLSGRCVNCGYNLGPQPAILRCKKRLICQKSGHKYYTDYHIIISDHIPDSLLVLIDVLLQVLHRVNVSGAHGEGGVFAAYLAEKVAFAAE